MEANAGEYIKNYLHLKRFPRISLHCKLVPVQYWEYKYGLFGGTGQIVGDFVLKVWQFGVTQHFASLWVKNGIWGGYFSLLLISVA